MKIARMGFGLLLAALSASSLAQRAPMPIVDYVDVAVAKSNPRPIGADQVKEAIVAAGKRLNWEMAPAAGGGLVGTLVVENKHTIVVDIPVAADKYSVKYRSSINMRYAMDEQKPSYRNWNQPVASPSAMGASTGVRVIHPAYNQWVKELMSAIDGELRHVDPARPTADNRAPPAVAPAAGVDFVAEARKSARILGCAGSDPKLTGAERGNVLFTANCGDGKQLLLSCDAAGLCLKRE